jgi:predicted DNA binding protein
MLGHEATTVADDASPSTHAPPADPQTAGDGFSLVATVELSSPVAALSAAIEAVPDATVEPEYETDGWTFVTVETDRPDRFDRAVGAAETGPAVRRVDDGTSRLVYQVEGDLTGPARTDLEAGVFVESRTVTADGWLLRVRFADRDALTAFVDAGREAGVTPSVRSLVDTDRTAGSGTSVSPGDAALLRRAYDEGYFDVPRRASQADLAAEFGISSSGVSKRLRRVTETLVSDVVGPASGDRRD